MPDGSNDADATATQDVIATTDSYGGPVSDEELAEVYLPEGQDEVHSGTTSGSQAATDEATAAASESEEPTGGDPVPSPDGTGAPAAPTVEPPD